MTLGFSIYYFGIRKRYINTIHTKINLNQFSNDFNGMEKMIDWYFTNYHIPAIVVGIVENGKIVKFISRGVVSKKSNLIVDENSIFQIASTSKTLTGIICKSLELEGIIDLDRTISEYLHGNLTDETENVYSKVTLRNVVNHRSGLGRSMYAYSEKDILQSLSETDLEFEPNKKYQYSNFGYALLTLILENETGKSYEQLLKEYVSDKYELPKLYADKISVDQNSLVTPYWKDFRFLEGKTYDFGVQVGASGVFTNAKTLAELMVYQVKDYQLFDSLKNTSPLILTHPKAETWDSLNFYGYGLFEFNYKINEKSQKIHKNLEHGGDADGFACIYDFFPEYEAGMIILTSSGGKWLQEMSRQMNTNLINRNYEQK